MHGIGLDQDVREWFDGDVPRTRVPDHSSRGPSKA